MSILNRHSFISAVLFAATLVAVSSPLAGAAASEMWESSSTRQHFVASGHSASTVTSNNECPSSGYTNSAQALTLSGDCTITGDVQLSGSATLSMTGGMLVIKGNLVLDNSAKLTVTNGGLGFAQTNYSQYSATLNNQSQLTLTNSIFVTNATQSNNFSMNLQANDSSVVDFQNSSLNTDTGSWLLGNFGGNSKLIMQGSQNLPTEIYPTAETQIAISNSNFASIWLDFPAGSNGTVQIPVLDSNGNFSFSFGPATGIGYAINMVSSQTRLGLNSHPHSTLIVNGNPTTGTKSANVVFGYYVENNTGPVSIDGLMVDAVLTHRFTDQGRVLQLNYVNLNPFSWQVYVSQSNKYPVTITNSLINEIAALTNGIVNVSNCVLQLAVAGAEAPGSVMNITNSQVWSQVLQAENGGHLTVSNSQLHGNLVTASGSGSSIAISNVAANTNGISSQTCTAVNGYPPNSNGVPLCNPYNPLHQCVQVAAATGGATITANPALTCSQ